MMLILDTLISGCALSSAIVLNVEVFIYILFLISFLWNAAILTNHGRKNQYLFMMMIDLEWITNIL